MKTRKEITKRVAERYRRASEADKGKILAEFCATFGYNAPMERGCQGKGKAARAAVEGWQRGLPAREDRAGSPSTRKRSWRRSPRYGPSSTFPAARDWSLKNEWRRANKGSYCPRCSEPGHRLTTYIWPVYNLSTLRPQARFQPGVHIPGQG